MEMIVRLHGSTPWETLQNVSRIANVTSRSSASDRPELSSRQTEAHDWLPQKLSRRLRRRIDLAIDQHPAGILTARPVELPGDMVAFTRELRPFRSFFGVLFQPEMAVFVGERAEVRIPQVLSPRFHILQRGQSVYHPSLSKFCCIRPAFWAWAHGSSDYRLGRVSRLPRTGKRLPIACAAPGFINMVVAYPASVAANFGDHVLLHFRASHVISRDATVPERGSKSQSLAIAMHSLTAMPSKHSLLFRCGTLSLSLCSIVNAEAYRRTNSGKHAHRSSYCANCPRDSRGRIARDASQIRAFRSNHPCPATGSFRGASLATSSTTSKP